MTMTNTDTITLLRIAADCILIYYLIRFSVVQRKLKKETGFTLIKQYYFYDLKKEEIARMNGGNYDDVDKNIMRALNIAHNRPGKWRREEEHVYITKPKQD